MVRNSTLKTTLDPIYKHARLDTPTQFVNTDIKFNFITN